MDQPSGFGIFTYCVCPFIEKKGVKPSCQTRNTCMRWGAHNHNWDRKIVFHDMSCNIVEVNSTPKGNQ